MNEITCIIVYTIAWFLFSFLFLRKEKNLNIVTLIPCIYAITSVTSIVFYYNAPEIRAIFNITFTPFVYLFACVLICIIPLVGNTDVFSKIKLIRINDRGFLPLAFFLLSPLIFISFTELSILAYNSDAVSLSDAYSNKTDISQSLSKAGAYGYLFCHFFVYAFPFLFFYCLKKEELKYKICSVIIFLAFWVEILQGYVGGSRVILLRFFLYFLIVFLLMKNYLAKAMVRKIKIISACAIGLAIMGMALITFGRLNDMGIDYDILNFITLYTGEGDIRFSQYIWDLNRTGSGDVCFSLLKNIFGYSTFTDNFLRRDFYENYLNIPSYIFYTFIGDFYQDFGRIGTFVFCIIINRLLTFSINRIKRHNYECSLINMFFLSVMFQIFYFGFMYYNYKTYSDQLQLAWSLLSILAFNYVSARSYNSKRIIVKK